MKKFLIVLISFVLASIELVGQDTIFVSGGKKMIVNVIELTQQEVKFKFFGTANNTLFMKPLEEVQLIVYKNGTRDSFQNLPRSQGLNAPEGKEAVFPIVKSNRIFLWNSRRIEETEIINLSRKFDSDSKMNSSIKMYEYYKRRQKRCVVGGIVLLSVGFGMVCGGIVKSFQSTTYSVVGSVASSAVSGGSSSGSISDDDGGSGLLVGGFVVGFSGLVFEVASFNNKSKRREKRDEIIFRHNELIVQ